MILRQTASKSTLLGAFLGTPLVQQGRKRGQPDKTTQNMVPFFTRFGLPRGNRGLAGVESRPGTAGGDLEP